MRRYAKKLFGSFLLLLSITGIPYVVYLLLIKVWNPQGSPAKKQAVEPTMSIVLPTYNEERIIENKLKNIITLDYPMEKVELVVVDSSDDETRELIQEFLSGRDAPALTMIEENERRGLAPALNDAYEVASNEIVVKTDCDSKLAANTLREAAANLSDPDVAAVTGRNVDVLGGSDVERGYRDIQERIQTLESHLDSTFIFHGPFSAFENKHIVSIDPNSIADDTELALKIRKQGKRVVFDPTIKYKEASHSAFSKRRRQKDRRAMGLLRLLFQQRGMLGRFGLYGSVVLPFNWWFMFISPWLLWGALGVGTMTSVIIVGPLGLSIPIGIAVLIWLGSKDRLGKIQPIYSIIDAQFSLSFALIKLLRGKGSAVWEIDEEIREEYE